jgi:hypothetical protein
MGNKKTGRFTTRPGRIKIKLDGEDSYYLVYLASSMFKG